ncbi:MAG: CNNM domain-containing protein [Thermoanaerobaculia bacterium]|nr:CNNM domain-containing protein [Thermoanaerobaculia bacterium]
MGFNGFVCSILEATLLSSRRAELLERKSRGDPGAALLLELRSHRVDDAIGAILTLNTIAHTVGSTLAGAQAAIVFGEAWVGVFSGVLTFLVLVVTEIVPKTLGTVYASQLAGPAAHTIQTLIRLLRPVLAAIRLLTRRLLPHATKPRISRGQIAALAESAVRDGALSDVVFRTVTSSLRLRDIRLGDVLVPRTVAAMRPLATTLAGFLADDEARSFARIPLYRSEPDDAAAYLLQRDALAAVIEGRPATTPLADFARPAVLLPESLPVDLALERLTDGREQLALVFDEHGSLAGLVTLEDLVEAALGVEIVDETDRVVDLRAAARERHETRLSSIT